MELLILLAFSLRIVYIIRVVKLGVLERECVKASFNLNQIHLSVVGHMLVLPQLLLVSLCKDNLLGQLTKLILSLASFVITIVSLQLQGSDSGICEEKRICRLHEAVEMPLTVTTFIFLISTILNLICKTRLKEYILNLRIVGAIFEELSSRGCHCVLIQILALLLAIGLSTGAKREFEDTFSGLKDKLEGFALESLLGEDN